MILLIQERGGRKDSWTKDDLGDADKARGLQEAWKHWQSCVPFSSELCAWEHILQM